MVAEEVAEDGRGRGQQQKTVDPKYAAKAVDVGDEAEEDTEDPLRELLTASAGAAAAECNTNGRGRGRGKGRGRGRGRGGNGDYFAGLNKEQDEAKETWRTHIRLQIELFFKHYIDKRWIDHITMMHMTGVDKLTNEPHLVLQALRRSELVEVSEDQTRVRSRATPTPTPTPQASRSQASRSQASNYQPNRLGYQASRSQASRSQASRSQASGSQASGVSRHPIPNRIDWDTKPQRNYH